MTSTLACSDGEYYNKEQVGQIVAAAVTAALQSAATQNLDSNIITDDYSLSDINKQEGDVSMSSTHREIYTYMSDAGDIKTIRINGSSKAETDRKFQKFLTETKIKSCPTVKEFVETVYYPGFIESLAKNTVSNYNVYLNRYIYPFLGDMQMNLVNVSTIQQFYDYLAGGKSHGFRNDLNKKSIDRISGLCSRIFKVAVEMDILSSSPFKRTLLRNRGTSAGHHKAIPDDVAQSVRSNIPRLANTRQRLYMGLLCYTGLRREEIFGMRWEHLNIKEGYGEVHCVVVYPGNSKPILKETPKTASSERTFILPKPLVDILLPERIDSGFVIHGKDPEELLAFSTAQRMYRNAFIELGIGEYNNHDWRTTYATELKESGMTSAQVADLLGHADTRMVETVYARARHDGIMKNKLAIDCILNPNPTSVEWHDAQ